MSRTNIQLRWGVAIPMRDGISLRASLYLPGRDSERVPCIVALTPYTVHRNHPRATFFAEHGYGFLVIDARGRGNSEGQFRPLIQEAEDGVDIVEWVAAQPFCDGQVAMYSGSYEGYVQWVTAAKLPAHLKTIAPAVSCAPGVDFPMRNNIAVPYFMRWLTNVAGHTSQERIFDDQEFWRNRYYEWYKSGRPLRDFDRMAGAPSEIFQEWLSHSVQHSYWADFRPAAIEYSQLSLPILTVTGCYDLDQPGALYHYREHITHASPEAAARHYLIIGPWDHRGAWAGSGGLKSNIGGLEFAPIASVDIMQLYLEWYDWIMRGGSRPRFLEKRVAYYVAGAEKWRYCDTLEAVTRESRPLYLDSSGEASQVFASGTLKAVCGTGAPDTYIYDPRDTRFADAELECDQPFTLLRPTFPTDDPTDQRLVYANEGNTLIYHSAPFSRATQVSGFFRLEAWISINQPDTDFMVTIYEITSAGQSILLTSDVMRARYREGARTEKLIGTHDPLQYTFDGFTFIARELRRGSRLRLIVGPINSIFYERNCNSGGVVHEESISDARIVTVSLWHDPRYPSALYVPYG